MDSKTFCVAPWVHACVGPSGNLSPCCVFRQSSQHNFRDYDQWLNSDDMKDLRRDLHQGRQHSGCERCWRDERIGNESLRQIYNREFALQIDPHQLDQDWMAKDATTLDLKLGNLCNLKCVMCDGDSSSQIMSEYKNHLSEYQALAFHKAPAVDTDFDWPLSQDFGNFLQRFQDKLVWVKFTGGEPTIIPYVIKTLAEIDHADRVTVSLTTNAHKLSTGFVSSLKRFRSVWISVSLEGVGDHNQQIRYLSDWSQVERNMYDLANLPNVHFNVNHVLQCFSVETLIPLIQWCDNRHYRLQLVLLALPPYLGINSVDPVRIDKFYQDLRDLKSLNNQHAIDRTLEYLTQHKFDPELQKQRKQYLAMIDHMRDTQLNTLIEENT